MAVTSNTYTVGGSGQAGPYSYAFPIIASTDIRVSVNGIVKTVTTHYTIDTANTRITFVSGQEPSTGDKVIVYRDTDEDPINATFVSGSTIRSNELNDNFKQLLYISQESDNQSMSTLGGTMQANFTMGKDADLVFEGATDNAHETTITVVDPTADRTITFPNVTGTVVTTGDTGTVTSAMITDGTIVDGDIANTTITASKIANDTLTSNQIAANAIGNSELANNAVETANILDAQVTGAKIANDTIFSAQIGANAIGNSELANNAVETANILDGAVTAAKIANDTITANQINANAIGSSELGNDAVLAANIADDQVQNEHIAVDAVQSTQIAANAVVSGKIDNNAVLTAKIANLNVTTDKLANNAVTTAKINADAIDSTKIADNAIGTEHIADAELTTLAGMQSGTASVLAGSTALTSTLTELNMLDGKSIITSISGSSTDVQLPTAKAVDDRVTALVTDVGGFRPIANETSFPATNPDPDDDAGTIVSVKALASNLTSNGSGVATIANGAGSGNTVTINGMANSDTIEAGKGILVETTSTLHTYTFHRETLAPADITAAKTAVDDFNERYRVNAGEPSSSLHEGDLVYDTNADKMKVYDTTTSAWKEVTSTGDFKYLFLCPAGGTGAPTINGSIATYDLREGSNSGSAASVTNAAQLIVSVNGVVQKANTGTSAPAEGFALVDANTIIFSANLPTGASVFIHQSGSAVSIPVPGDNTVSTIKIQNLAVTNGKIADDTITEAKLDIHQAPSDGKFLKYTSSNGMEWGDTFTGNVYFESEIGMINGTTNAARYIDAGLGDNNALWIRGTSGGDTAHETLAKFTRNGGCELYFDTAKKFETVTGGATITGVCTATSFAGDGSSLTGVDSSKADGCIWENDQTISNNYTIASGKGAHSVGPITVNATVTVNGNWVVS